MLFLYGAGGYEKKAVLKVTAFLDITLCSLEVD
jgi:hypothetical protein